MMNESIGVLPFVDHAQLPIHRAYFQPLIFNPLSVVIQHGDVDIRRQVDDFMDQPSVQNDVDFAFLGTR